MGRRSVLPIAIAFLSAAAVATPGPAIGPAIGAGDAGEEVYLERFSGQWSATGAVRENAQSDAREVSCELTGTNAGTSAAIRGTCRALGVFTRDISVELSFDADTGRYSGVYTGSPAGAVALSGTRSGNVLTLNATWPKPINGDRAATMIIRNPEPGRFTFLVVDRIAENGPIETMTNLSVAAL